MAILTFTVGPSGKDYSSLSSALAAEATDLVANGDSHVFEMYQFAGGHNSNSAFLGYTTGPSNTITITSPLSERWDGIDPTSGFYFANTGSATIRPISGVQNLILEHLCFVGGSAALASSNGGRFESITNCGLKDIPGDNVFINVGTIDNMLIINPGDDGMILTSSPTVNNVTVINAGNRGIVTTAGCALTNAFVYGSTSVDINKQGGSVSYVATEDSTATGTGSLPNRTSSDFVDFANEDYRTASGSVLATAGLGGTFIGYNVESSSALIDITPTSVNTSWTAFNYGIDLTGEISVTPNSVNTTYNSNNYAIELTGEISVTPTTVNTSYAVNNYSINLSGLISVNPNSVGTSYIANDYTVTLQGTIEITPESVNANWLANSYTINLSQVIYNGKRVKRVNAKHKHVRIRAINKVKRVN